MLVALNDHPVSRRLKTPTSHRQATFGTLQFPPGHQKPLQNAWMPHMHCDN